MEDVIVVQIVNSSCYLTGSVYMSVQGIARNITAMARHQMRSTDHPTAIQFN
ncbi:hypothetical protein BDW68DRAFT_153091 [Aspergillus falconensis]